MKNQSINKILIYISCLITGLTITSCSDWTEVEAVNIIETNIEEQNPELYAAYLEDLRNYKKSNHKIVMGWFDNNEKVPFSKAHHYTSVPDSIDILSIIYPDNLESWEIEEINRIRNDKGIAIILSIDYDEIKLAHTNQLIDYQNDDEGILPKPDEFINFMADSVVALLSIANKYNYDGISVGYTGKSSHHMTEEDLQEYAYFQNAYFDIIKDWQNRQKDKLILYAGKPQYLLDKTFLNECKYIIVPTTDAANSSALNYNVAMANIEGVPSERFIVTAATTSLDASDTKTGYWADNSNAISSSALWVMSSHTAFTPVGLAIHNVNHDYFNSEQTYRYTREAINIMNPSLKK